jgi:hypothetical protein
MWGKKEKSIIVSFNPPVSPTYCRFIVERYEKRDTSCILRRDYVNFIIVFIAREWKPPF